MHWSAAYVGLTWQEVGEELCWGLYRKVFQDRTGIVLPTYVDRHGGVSDDHAAITALLRGETANWPWQPVSLGQERELDLVVFSRGGVECHVGTVVEPGRMLHLAQGYDARVESFDKGRWRLRLACIYRHEGLIARHAA